MRTRTKEISNYLNNNGYKTSRNKVFTHKHNWSIYTKKTGLNKFLLRNICVFSKIKFMRLFILFTLFFAGFTSSCLMSSEDIEKEVGPGIVKNICEEMNVNEEDVTLKECTLTHESGNNYTGFLKTRYDGFTQTFDIEVTYESSGKYTFKWELISEK